jgi:hypothetical protein
VDDPPPQPEVRRTFTRGDVTTYMNYYPDPPDFIHLGFTHDDVIIPRLEAVDYSDWGGNTHKFHLTFYVSLLDLLLLEFTSALPTFSNQVDILWGFSIGERVAPFLDHGQPLAYINHRRRTICSLVGGQWGLSEEV